MKTWNVSFYWNIDNLNKIGFQIQFSHTGSEPLRAEVSISSSELYSKYYHAEGVLVTIFTINARFYHSPNFATII